MARFSEGFLRDIRNYGRMSPTEGRRQPMQATPSVYQQMGTTDPLARRVGSLFSNLGVDTSYMQTGEERAQAAMQKAGEQEFASPEARMIAMLEAQLPTLRPQAQMQAMDQIRQLRDIERQRAETEQERQAETAAIQTELQGIMQSNAPPVVKKRAQNILRGFIAGGMKPSETLNEQMEVLRASVAAPSGQNYVVVGNRVFDKNTGEYVTPDEAADELNIKDLKGIFTPESITDYVKTGNRDVLEAIAGEGEEDERGKLISALQTVDNTLEIADKAIGLSDEYWAAPYWLTSKLPLTDARELNNYVKTLQSNLAFDRLQKMRDQSKTGGALGQVSNIELDLLKSSVSALDPMSGNFKEQLQTVRTSYENFRNALLGIEPKGKNYFKDPETGVLYYIKTEGGREMYININELAKQEAANMGVK